MNPDIRVEKEVHIFWEHDQAMKKRYPEWRCYEYIGKMHYFYFYKQKKISLISCQRGMAWRWVICSGGTCSNCLDADETFRTKKEAEKRIEELLLENE